MANDKQVEVWALRFKPPSPEYDYGPIYMLYPFEPTGPWRHDVPDSEAAWMSTYDFERLWSQYALEPGGGPVRVR